MSLLYHSMVLTACERLPAPCVAVVGHVSQLSQAGFSGGVPIQLILIALLTANL